MNKIVFVLVLVLFQSCIENKNDTIQKKEVSKTEDFLSKKIPSINFDALQPFLNKNNDTTYIINFWATWCKPCVKELPAFEKINTLYKAKKVKVLLVSLDFPKQLESKVIPFVEDRKIKSQVVLLKDPDANSWIPKVDESWSGAIPATLIYNADNRKFYERSFTYKELENELKLILKQITDENYN